jgi:threonine dehydrogenase-like Zn-dependent dehydrogenase
MKAVAWRGGGDVRVDKVPDPSIQAPNDAVIRITSTAICGSDLHLEPMGMVEEVAPAVTNVSVRAAADGPGPREAAVPEILPHLGDDDPLGTQHVATHHLPLTEAPDAYRMFQKKKQDGCVKVVLGP